MFSMGSGKGLQRAFVNCHKSSMEHINIEAHNPEFRIAGNVFYHCLVNFWIQCVQFLAAKTFVCRGNCYPVTTTNPPFGVPDSALKLNDSASLSLSSSDSVGSSPGKYVGSNWNGWKPLILKRKQRNNEESIHNSTCVYLVSLDCEISVPHIIRQSILLT